MVRKLSVNTLQSMWKKQTFHILLFKYNITLVVLCIWAWFSESQQQVAAE